MRGVSWRFGGAVALLVALGSALEPGAALAQTLTASSRTVYHAYEIPLWPERDIGNRNLNRFYQTVNLGAWSLLGGDVDATLSLRYDTDFGTGFHVDTPMDVGIPAVGGRNDFDLMYAYVDWRNVVQDRLHARFGRQLLTDDLAWYVFDGVKLSGDLWRDGADGWDVELYVGLPVRFDAVFSSTPFLNDGTLEQDTQAFPNGVTFGGSSRLRAFGDLEVSMSYRHVLSFRDDELATFVGGTGEAPAASAGSIGLRESRLGASAGYTIRPARMHVYGSLMWDALVGGLEQARAGVGYDPIRGVHAQVEYLRSRPRFAGDSIFNWFNLFGYDRGRAEISVELIPGLVVEGGYFLQVFGGGTLAGSGTDYPGSDVVHGPSAGASYRTRRFGVGVYGEAATNLGGEYAYGGNYRTGWVWGDVAFFERRLVADARVSVTSVQSDWFAGVDDGAVGPVDTSVNLAVGGTGRITDWLGARLMVVRNVGAALEGTYRVYSELAVTY